MVNRNKPRNILLPIDGSKASLKAARYGLKLANQIDASVTLLHVVTIPQFPKYFRSAKKYYIQAEKEAQSWFDLLSNMREAGNVPIETKIITNAASVVEAIVGYATKREAELIILGTRQN